MRLSKSKKLRAQVQDAYAILNHDPQIFAVAVEAMLDELDHANLPDEEAGSLWLEQQCRRVLREVGVEVAQMNGMQLASLHDNTRTIRIKRSDVAQAKRVLARNMARLSVALLWLLPMVACASACGPAGVSAPAGSVRLTASPWCYDRDEATETTVAHFGVDAPEGAAWRVDLSDGAEAYVLPGKRAQASDAYVKVRVEGGPLPQPSAFGVVLYGVRDGAWVEVDRRLGAELCPAGE